MAPTFVFLFAIAVGVSPSPSYDFRTNGDWSGYDNDDNNDDDAQLLMSILKDARANDEDIPWGIDWAAKTTDPEINMGPAEIINRWDYPVEEYKVKTDDDYILSMQRISGRRWSSGEAPTNSTSSKPVLFLMHGLLASANVWIANLPNQSLAFLAADAGFDVWLGNARGNTYSKGHASLGPKDRNYWKFSFDEMAEFDLPAMVDFALEKSQQKQLYYAGHSQGSMVMFAKASDDRKFGRKIKKFFALGPVATIGHVQGAGKALGSKWVRRLIKAEDFTIGHGEFFATSWLIKKIASSVCSSKLKFLCANILFTLGGYDTAQMNQTRLPVYMTHTPAGTSVRNIIHFGQLIANGKFQKYDFDFVGNSAKYHSPTPPPYDVTKMQVATVLFRGGRDILADATDVEALIPKITNLAGDHRIADMDHLDFIWGLNAPEAVYEPIIRIIAAEEKL